jgi:hypothetical protein
VQVTDFILEISTETTELAFMVHPSPHPPPFSKESKAVPVLTETKPELNARLEQRMAQKFATKPDTEIAISHIIV